LTKEKAIELMGAKKDQFVVTAVKPAKKKTS